MMPKNIYFKISKILLYFIPFSAAIVYQGTLFPFIVGKYVFFRTIAALSLVFFVWGWALNEDSQPDKPWPDRQNNNQKFKNINFFKQPLAIAVSIFVFIYILAGFFGYNPAVSFWSNFERGEGALQLFSLLIYFILLVLSLKDEKSWNKMFIVAVSAAVLTIAYGLAAALRIGGFVGAGLCARFAGSLGNPAYTGTFLVFAMFYSSYLANKAEKGKRLLWLSLIVLFFIFLLLTQTRGALLGLGVAIIAGLIYLFFHLPKGKIKNVILALIIFLVISGGLAIKYRRLINIMPFCPSELGGGNRILDVDLSTETFQTRLLLWKESIEAFKDRPILGWGPENFTVAFEKHYDPHFVTWYDRAHNIFFDYLVMTGLFGLVSFISIFGVYYWKFFKFSRSAIIDSQNYGQKITNKLSSVNYQKLIRDTLLFALPIAYLVQGLVLFDVLPIYINLFMFLAFANWMFIAESKNNLPAQN